jgi:hypothetical protein
MRVGGCDQSVGPGPEQRLVLARYAEQAADHRDGQRVGEIIDDVDQPARLEGLHQFLGDPVDLAAHGIDPARAVRRAEGPHGEGAQPVVLRVVKPQERRLVCHFATAAGVDTHPRVVEQSGDLVVGADQVAAICLPHHGTGLAEFRVQRVGVGATRVVGDPCQQGLGGHRGSSWLGGT